MQDSTLSTAWRPRTLDKYTLAIVEINRESRIKVQPGAFRLSGKRLLVESGTPACHCAAKPHGRHRVPIKLTNTPLWLYFRSVRSSEKSVKL